MQTKHVISEARSSTNEILYHYYIISRTVYIRCARKCRMFISSLFFWISLWQTNQSLHQNYTLPFRFVSFNPMKKKFSLNRFWLPLGLAPGDICTHLPPLIATSLSLLMAGLRQIISSISDGSQYIFTYNFIITTFDCQGGGISARAFFLARPGLAPPLNQKFQFRQKIQNNMTHVFTDRGSGTFTSI